MRLTFAQLQAIVKAYVNPDKIGSTDFNASTNDLTGLIDKIGLQITLDGKFYDKLSMLDGEELPLGKTVEEWYQDLIQAEDYEENGEKFGKPAYPSYRKPTYSYDLGRKKFRTSKSYGLIQSACSNASTYADLVSTITKKLADSEATYCYKVKKQGLGVLATKVLNSANPSKTYAPSTAYEEGEFVKKDATPTAVGVIMKKLTSSNSGDWATNVANGNIVETHMVTTIAKPADTKTGENFIKQVKKDVENASFINEGNSLSGGVVGAEPGLYLILKKGILPELDVETFAGAFNAEKLALPAEIIVVDDFGDNKDAFAILADKRMLKLHNTYRATREDPNGDGDFITYIRHVQFTMHLSRNTYVHVYKEGA